MPEAGAKTMMDSGWIVITLAVSDILGAQPWQRY
jgi:hypothetical protein